MFNLIKAVRVGVAEDRVITEANPAFVLTSPNLTAFSRR